MDNFLSTDMAKMVYTVVIRSKKRPSEIIMDYNDIPLYATIFDTYFYQHFESKNVNMPSIEKINQIDDELELMKVLGVNVAKD